MYFWCFSRSQARFTPERGLFDSSVDNRGLALASTSQGAKSGTYGHHASTSWRSDRSSSNGPDSRGSVDFNNMDDGDEDEEYHDDRLYSENDKQPRQNNRQQNQRDHYQQRGYAEPSSKSSAWTSSSDCGRGFNRRVLKMGCSELHAMEMEHVTDCDSETETETRGTARAAQTLLDSESLFFVVFLVL